MTKAPSSLQELPQLRLRLVLGLGVAQEQDHEAQRTKSARLTQDGEGIQLGFDF